MTETGFFTADSGQTKKDDFISIRPTTAERIPITPKAASLFCVIDNDRL
jgi:hypothetical protein